VPYNLGEGPVLYRNLSAHKPDMAFMEVTPMNGQGVFQFWHDREKQGNMRRG
jgi:hypothetical protein